MSLIKGDKVIINLSKKYFHFSFKQNREINDKWQYEGKEAIITGKDLVGIFHEYRLDIDNGKNLWDFDMLKLKPLSEQESEIRRLKIEVDELKKYNEQQQRKKDVEIENRRNNREYEKALELGRRNLSSTYYTG